VKVKKGDSTPGNVVVSVLTDGTSGSDNFGDGVDDGVTISFAANLNPTLSSANNATFTKGAAATAIPTITLTDSPVTASITLANDIRIRVPAGFNAIFDNTVTNPAFGGTASARVTNPVTYSGDFKTVTINVTTTFAVNNTLTVSNLRLKNFNSESNGSLELSFDGGTTYQSIDDKAYSILDNGVPTITGRETADRDGDGFIDAVRIVFSKNINDGSVNVNNFAIAGVTGKGFSSTTLGDVANDNDIYITFTDGVLGTVSTPGVQYTQGTLADLVGNLLASEGAAVNAAD